MSLQLLSTTIEVLLAGEAALTGLACGAKLEVVAAVSQALYLRSEAGELFWIVGENSPMHRRSLRIATNLPALTVGSHLEIRERAPASGQGIFLELAQAHIWTAPMVAPGKSIPLAEMRERTILLFQQLVYMQAPSGFGSLLPGLMQKWAGEQPTPHLNPQEICPAAAWPFVDQITNALRVHEFDSLPHLGRHLVGLGQGLTPSGDDFLGGLFYCLSSMKHAFPGLVIPKDDYFSALILMCKGGTNPISFALLEDHARGYTLEPMQWILHGLLTGSPVEALLACGRAMTCVGHSTGWDILTGFLAGLFVTWARTPVPHSS